MDSGLDERELLVRDIDVRERDGEPLRSSVELGKLVLCDFRDQVVQSQTKDIEVLDFDIRPTTVLEVDHHEFMKRCDISLVVSNLRNQKIVAGVS
jgi:hypothetical protein